MKGSLTSFSFLLFLPAVFLNTQFCDEEERIVKSTETGLIRGQVVTSRFNSSTKYYSFRPVPYAKPPVGKFRFQAPEPADEWSGIRNATHSMVECAQISNKSDGDDLGGIEDCLYLEIFVAITARKTENECGSLPVMVWFHGGAFVFANPSETTPDFLMEKPVIFVGVQYRLNVFGFLSTKDRFAEGNNGLKDQLYALKWIKRNIKNFGGDPERVTIFGQSAGGASVVYHLLSPKSRGYFQRAISQSGSSLDRWGYRPNPREMAFRLGRGLGINTLSSRKLIKHLQEVDPRTLVLSAFNESIMGFYLPYYDSPFVPSLERKGPQAFISERMFESLKRGNFAKVPYMLGFNTEEGSWAYEYIVDGRVNINLYNEHPELLVPSSMNIRKGSRCEKKVLKDIEDFYFKDGNLTNPYNWVPFISQDIFVRGISKTVEFVHKHIPAYFYKFSYIGEYHIGYLGGVGHYGEMQYLYYTTGMSDVPITTPKDLEISKRLVTLWTNFAKTGNPTPAKDELLQNITWPTTDDKKTCLWIDKDLSIIQDPNQADDEFWQKEFDTCGNPPYTIY